MNESYVFYASFDEALRELPDKSRLKVYDAVSDYALRGIEPDFNGMEKAIFILIKTQIDRRNKRVEIGRKGGQKSQANSKHSSTILEPNLNHTSSMPEDNSKLTPSYLEVNSKLSRSYLEVNSTTKEEVSPNEKERSKEKDITLEEENILERKKENKKELSTTGAHACETIPDFSKMTDEELIAWGENSMTDFEDENSIDSFYAWNGEMEKRSKTVAKWTGKLIKSGKHLHRLKSHADIMNELGASAVLQEALKEFLRHCYINRRLVTNEKLSDIILRLDEACDDNDGKKCEYIRRAISGGFFDIKAGR